VAKNLHTTKKNYNKEENLEIYDIKVQANARARFGPRLAKIMK